MTNINITSFRKDIYNLLENIIKYNEPINISTKNGNAVVLSLYLESTPDLRDELIKRSKDSEKEFVYEKNVEW